MGDKENQVATKSRIGSTILLNIAAIAAIVIVAGTAMGGLFYFTVKESSYTNQFLVLTGHRTRDTMASNSFSMQTVLGDDPKTRLYLCMMQSGIGQGAAECPASKSVTSFRDCLKLKGKDCETSSDGNWPRDHGFLQCLGDTFVLKPNMVNKFVQCEDLADSFHVDSVQTPYSMLFLGSYNFASLLLVALAALGSFMVFTAGGIFSGSELSTGGEKNNLNGMFSPLSNVNLYVAFGWSVACLCGAFAYSFPIDCDGEICISKARAYPTTPWTGILCIGMLFGLVGYYLSYIFELHFDYEDKDKAVADAEDNRVVDATTGYPEIMPPTYGQQQMTYVPSQPVPSIAPTALPWGPSQYNPNQYSQFYPSPAKNAANVYFAPAAGAVPFANPYQQVSVQYPESRKRTRTNSKFNNSKKYSFLGVRLLTGDKSQEFHEEEEIFPLMVEAFAWAFIFVDGPLFLGMINSQNSPMHEHVTIMFVAITACRVLQLAVAKFMNEAFIVPMQREKGWKSSISPKQFGTQVTLIFTYVASVGLLLIALYNFMNANSILEAMSKSVNSPAYAIEICFALLVGILPEVVRSIQLGVFCVTDLPPKTILFWTEVLFFWNWLMRVVMVIIALFAIPSHLKEQSDSVLNFMSYSPYIPF